MPSKETLDLIYDREQILFLRRRYGESDVIIFLHSMPADSHGRQNSAREMDQDLDSTSPVWGGAGELTIHRSYHRMKTSFFT
jgi:hypothetical protein